MIIRTSRFGEIEIAEESVITFPEGIPGFPGQQRFVLRNDGLMDTPFWWLQNVDEGGLSFLAVEPRQVVADYDFPIPEEMLALLGLLGAPTDVVEALAIISVPAGELRRATVNLKAPVLINPTAKLGGQLVLDRSPYAIRHPLFAATEV